MAKVRVVTLSQTVALAASAGGNVKSRAYLCSERDPLNLVQHELAPGATLSVVGDPADKLIYVLQGSVTSCGTPLVEGSSMIVEFGAGADIVAGIEDATVLVFNQAQRPPDARPGGHLHLLPREAVPRTHDLGTRNEMGGGIHSDASCPTCTVWLHENDFHSTTGSAVPLHSHSEDEVIFVTAGEIRLGNRTYGRGTAIAIAADTIYSFDVPACGLSFINFRTASPTARSQNGTTVVDEAEFWVSRIGRPQYVEAIAG